MALHSLAAKLILAGIAKRTRQHNGSGDASFLKLNSVVHTAQRARASSTQAGDGDFYVLCHGVEQCVARRLGVVLLAHYDYTCDGVTIDQSIADGFECWYMRCAIFSIQATRKNPGSARSDG